MMRTLALAVLNVLKASTENPLYLLTAYHSRQRS